MKEITDPFGNKFRSISAMCKFHNVDYTTYTRRRNRGFSVEDALTGKGVHDHKGNSYKSYKELYKAYGITRDEFINEVRNGKSLKDILEREKPEKKRVYDHLGNEYKYATDMCKAYGVTVDQYYGRLKRGYSLEEALTLKTKNHENYKSYKFKVKDHLGNKYEHVRDMCKEYKVTTSAYYGRLKRGHTIKEALTGDGINHTLNHHKEKEKKKEKI